METQFLLGKTCLITGGAEGIGWAIAQALADYGGDVYVCDISDENIARAQAELEKLPWKGKIHFRLGDISVRDEAEVWVREIYQHTGQIDVLINNAAHVRWDDVAEMSVEDLERIMQVGYNGMIYTIKAVLPAMLKAKQGHIFNISSSAGKLFISRSDAAYAAVKAAIDGFTETLSIELEGTGVTSTVVRLGVVGGTDFFRKHVPSSRLPRMGDFIPSLTPPQVAEGFIRALRTKQSVLDIPGYLPMMFLFFEQMPGVFRWLVKTGGSGRKDYGAIEWHYDPKNKISAQ